MDPVANSDHIGETKAWWIGGWKQRTCSTGPSEDLRCLLSTANIWSFSTLKWRARLTSRLRSWNECKIIFFLATSVSDTRMSTVKWMELILASSTLNRQIDWNDVVQHFQPKCADQKAMVSTRNNKLSARLPSASQKHLRFISLFKCNRSRVGRGNTN